MMARDEHAGTTERIRDARTSFFKSLLMDTIAA